ncbi:hypothetical protein HJG54_19240 [Leptolyngbya sp. NK1-12]|uniref:Uncharacterized protein n=1 Tax=Leptolyngbya sp. NK1-12 TaxID=2547451 RepID=A0AA97AJC6_9CYAN|nr:hypothetical protein [Leptolyngbya sp. NK1-12]WNZ24766.1 hypothetical protein HJG54_19240 [Leptolyngbya sp. NK1-12]
MFEQKTFARQQSSFLNGQLDANRYASVFDSASLESALTSSRSTDLPTDLRSEKSASYQGIPVAESFNQASLMDAGIATAPPSSMDFTQALNTTWNPEASVWNQSATWGSDTIWGTDSDFSGMRPAGLSLKNAWNSVKDKAKNADWKKIGHGALDVVGALPIPVVSTAADLVNAGWYAAEGDYKNAAMSAIGAAPGVGDGAKLALKAADAAKTARSARTTTRLTTRTANTPPRPGLAPSPRRETPGLAPTPKPAARRPETPTAAPRREPSGRPDSNPIGAPARRSARRPDPTPSGAVNKPDPRRSDPKPSPTTPKKSEPSRPEGNPTPPGTREQPPRPNPKPETVGTSPSQRPETPASGRDPRLQESPNSVRPTSLERFTRASDRAEHLSQRLDQINNHVDLFQQMQGGNAETGEPSAVDFAFAGLDALVGMRSGRGRTSLSRLVHSEGSTQPATRVAGGGGPQSVIRHADQSQSPDQFTPALASVGGRSNVDLPRASAGSGGRGDRTSRLNSPGSAEPPSPSPGGSGGLGNDRLPPRTGGSGGSGSSNNGDSNGTPLSEGRDSNIRYDARTGRWHGPKGFVADPNRPPVDLGSMKDSSDERVFITYSLRDPNNGSVIPGDRDGLVTYYGFASGDVTELTQRVARPSTPFLRASHPSFDAFEARYGKEAAEVLPDLVMKYRLSSHDHFRANSDLVPRIEAIHGSEAAGLGAEDIWFTYHQRAIDSERARREVGTDVLPDLTNKQPPSSNKPYEARRKGKALGEAYSDDLRESF